MCIRDRGRTIGAVSFLQILAPELNDRMLADFLEMDSKDVYKRQISRRRTIQRKSDLWESRHSQISWYRKFCGWFSKRCMSLFSCQFPMDSDPKGAAIPH